MTSEALVMISGPQSTEFPIPESDARLLSGLQAGEEQAYEELIERYQHSIYSLVQRLIDNPDEAGDIVQEVFLKVFRNVGNFRGQSSIKTWMYRIAVNEAHNRRRWFGRHKKPEIALDNENERGRSYADSLCDNGRSPFDLTLNHERQALLVKTLEELNPVYREAVVLRDIEDLSYEDIAEVLDVSLGTVKSRILRGREALRQALTEKMEPARGMEFTPQPAE